MTYVPADPLLSRSIVRAVRRAGRTAGAAAGLPADAVFLESGRVSLWGALQALGLGPGDRLVVPAYICDSILPALAALGVEARYVGTDRALAPDLTALETELRAGARAALAVHYFGFPAPLLEEMAALCARHGAELIEDCAHALFGRADGQWIGRRGSAAIFSPWKSLPLPDGGILGLNGRPVPPALSALQRPPLLLTARRLVYRSVGVVESAVGRSPRLWLLRSWGLRRAMQSRAAEATLVPRRGSALAEAIVRGVDAGKVVARRRANYLRLEQTLRGTTWARPLYPELPSGVSPLGFPILVEDRERRRRQFLHAGVNVRAYWEQLPDGVTVERFADSHYVAERILVLPVHQSLTPSQMTYLIDVLERLEAA